MKTALGQELENSRTREFKNGFVGRHSRPIDPVCISRKEFRFRVGVFCALFALLFGGGSVLWGCQSSEEVKPAPPPLSYTFDSPEALAQAFLDALYLEDADALKQFGLSKDEFRLHVWPELPVSKLDKPLPFEYGWNDLYQKSMNSLRRTFANYSGRKLTFISLEFEDETTDYETFKVHRDGRVVVFDEERQREVRLDLFGSIMEKDGRFKLFSYVTD